MSIVVTVRYDVPTAKMEQLEADEPGLFADLMAVAMKHMTGHSRLAREECFMELDEYASEDAYRAFLAEAAPLIERINTALGAEPTDTVWTQTAG